MKKGSLVLIEFLDHCQILRRDDDPDSWDQPNKHTTVGFLIHESKTHYVLSSWICDNLDNEENDAMVIVKHKGMRVRRLR